MSDHTLVESRANPLPSEPLQIAVMGLGPIGQEIAQVLARKDWADLVAAVDVDPALEGRPLSEVAELDREVGVDVTPSLDVDCDLVAHATVSDLESATHQIVPHLKNGRSVVSTCEELAFPLNDRLARRIDEAARDGGSTVLGTGINPGFLLDALPAVLTVSCQSVDHVTASRIVNASERRGPLQEKVGAGLDLEEWRRRRDEGEIRHVGLPESARLLAAAVGWSDLTFSDEVIEPVTASRPPSPARHASPHRTVSHPAGGARVGYVRSMLERDVPSVDGERTEPADRASILIIGAIAALLLVCTGVTWMSRRARPRASVISSPVAGTAARCCGWSWRCTWARRIPATR